MIESDDIFTALLDERPRAAPPKVKEATVELDWLYPIASDSALDEIEDQIDARLSCRESQIPAQLAGDDAKTFLKMCGAALRALREERLQHETRTLQAVQNATWIARMQISLYRRALQRLLDDSPIADHVDSMIEAVAHTTIQGARKHAQDADSRELEHDEGRGAGVACDIQEGNDGET